MTERRKYTDEFKIEAAELVLSSGRPIAQVAADIGVNDGTLGKWVRKYRLAHPDHFPSGGDKAPVAWEEHQKALAQVAELRKEVEFLGKVSAFFAQRQR